MRAIDRFYLTERRRAVLSMTIRVVLPVSAVLGGAFAVAVPPLGLTIIGLVGAAYAWLFWETRP